MCPRSHALLIAIVGAFTIYFYVVNRRQDRGLKVIEGVVCFMITPDVPKLFLLTNYAQPGFRYTY
jgi:hypothetical protein